MYFIKNLSVSGVNWPFLALLLVFINFQSFSQSCDCPAIDECGPCEGGGLTSLTLRYDAPLLGAAIITVTDKGDTIFNDSVEDGAEFSFTGSLAGEPFVGDTVTITITNLDLELLSTTEIYTSCSTPVYVEDVYDKFTVTAGASLDGSPICCSEEAMEDVPPTITGCPADISVTLSDSECSTTVSWTPPTATDDCGIADSTSNHNPDDIFSVGTTEVIYTFTDIYGNSAVCSFNIEVKETIAPVISGCPENINLNTLAGEPCKAQAFWEEPTVSDNCSATLTSIHKPGDYFPRGKTTVTYTATDRSGNTTTCSFDVIANDNTKPVISGIPTSDVVITTDGACEAIVTWDEITATDNCGSVTLTSTHNSGDTFPVGTTKVTYTATDDTGNSTKSSFNVVVKDPTPPVISGCPSDIIEIADASCAAVVSWTAPTATDNCEKVTLKSTHKPGDTFPIGTTPVTYTATDDAGNTTTCTFNVVVTDETAPELSGCPASDIIVTADASCEAVAKWSAPTATDNCGNAPIASTHNPGDTFPIGTTPVTYTATDDAGNTTTCTFNVVVTDETAPELSGCPASDIIVTADASCEGVGSWTAPTATDNCGNVNVTSTHNSGDTFPIGTTTVTYTARDDAGNTSACSFDVVVTDETGPIFSGCPDSDIIMSTAGSCEMVVNWPEITATDNCGNATLTSLYNSGDVFPIGTTMVNYTATDEAGKTSTCSFNVIVNNKTAPVISGCPEDIIATVDESGQVRIDWNPPIAGVHCGEAILQGSHEPGDYFPLGTTEVEYIATDNAGNTASCTFNIILSYEEINFDIPKVITPDGDGINDEWQLTNIEKFKQNKVVIVDRWGSIIFNTSGYNNENAVWRGVNKNGGQVPSGTYFYTISVEFASQIVEKRGFIELIR